MKLTTRIINKLARIKRENFIKKNKNLFEIFTHLTDDEKLALYSISKKKCKSGGSVFVEIGSFLGASSCFIAKAINDQAKLYCIDTWGNHAMKYNDDDIDSEERNTFDEFNNNTKEFKGKITQLRGWSYDMIEPLKAKVNNIDFLFIDGDHNYDGVKKDWDLYCPLLKRGSIVAFHDTGWAEGVKQVIKEDVLKVSELVIRLPNLEFYKIV